MRFCFYLCRNEEAAKDLAQETFIKALLASEKNSELLSIKNPKSYLFQIAKNIFLDLKRRKKYETMFLSETGMDSNSIAPPDLEVWQALFQLDKSEQEVILLVDREGLSLFEAADFLGISEAALKSRLFRARENYKKNWVN